MVGLFILSSELPKLPENLVKSKAEERKEKEMKGKETGKNRKKRERRELKEGRFTIMQ